MQRKEPYISQKQFHLNGLPGQQSFLPKWGINNKRPTKGKTSRIDDQRTRDEQQ